MRCEEFSPRKYENALILLARGKETSPPAQEYYLHVENCPGCKCRFYEHADAEAGNLTTEQRGLVFEGLKIIGSQVGDND